jgi:hypothetical protein
MPVVCNEEVHNIMRCWQTCKKMTMIDEHNGDVLRKGLVPPANPITYTSAHVME